MFYFNNDLLTNIDWAIVCSSLGIVGFMETMAAVIIFEKTCLPDSAHQKIFLVLSGCFLFMGQVLLSLSAKFESAATISFLRKSFDMIFAFGIQILIFQVHNNLV